MHYDSYNKQLKAYLYNHLLELKNNKIKDDYNKLTQTRENMKVFLNKCYSKYNGLEDAIKTNSVDKYKLNLSRLKSQYGGNIEEKMQKIQELAQIYTTKLDANALEKTMKEITNQVNTMIKEINAINKEDFSKIDPEQFINDLETIKTNLALTGDRIKINTHRHQLYLPPKIPVPKDDDLITIDNVIGEIEKNISGLKSELDKSTFDKKATEIALQITNLKGTIGKIDLAAKISSIKDLRKKMKDNLEEMKNDLNTNDKLLTPTNLQLFRNFKTLEYLSAKDQTKYKLIYDFVSNSEFKKKTPELKVIAFNDFIKSEDFKSWAKANDQTAKEIILNPTIEFPDFLGDFSVKINQNLIYSSDTKGKLDTITKLLKITNDPDEKITEDVLKKIYVPNLAEYKNSSSSGGAGPFNDVEVNVSRLIAEKEAVKNTISSYQTEFNLYISEVKEYNRLSYDSYIHTLFLVSILTNKIIGPTDYVVYKFLNKGTIELYRRTLNEIIYKMEKEPDEPVIKYLRKYHNKTILVLFNFLTKLSQKIGAKDLINVNKCDSSVLDKFVMFNYFKTILDSYKAIFQNKVTIYARINDIGKGIEYKGVTDNIYDTNYLTAKMFASDYDRYDMYNTDKNVQGEAIENYPYDDRPVNTSLMYIRPKACGAIQEEKKMEAIKFTEVFDTYNFQDNEEISKSMLMDAQLTQKKGLAVMTYGYSGTGKTYTLFGKKADGIDGILQATIKNINGLESVQFRLFELFGYGQIYPFYWNQGDKDKGKSNLDMIEHFIIAYNLKIEKNNIVIAKDSSNNEIQIIEAENIEQYTSMKGKYNDFPIKFTGENAGETLKSFDLFIEEIENKRAAGHDIRGRYKAKTVRDTPNNVASSRSVLIYDFRLKMKDDKSTYETPFLIIDLPGREEVTSTYVEPYFKDNVIQRMLKIKYNDNFNDTLIFLKTMTASMALNPMALPLFSITESKDINEIKKMNLILDTFNELPQNERQKILTTAIRLVSHTDKGVVSAYVQYGDEIVNRKGSTMTGSKFAEISADSKITITDIRATRGIGYSSFQQGRSVCAIHLMNRLALTKRYDIIEKIYEKFCNHYINDIFEGKIEFKDNHYKIGSMTIDENLDEIKKMKGGLFSDLLKKEGVKDFSSFQVIYTAVGEIKMKEIYAKMFRYDYYLTPLEGIYINENIIGLIKFLADKLTGVPTTAEKKREKQEFFDKNVPKQSSELSFVKKQQELRYMLASLSKVVDAKDFVNLEVRFISTNPPEPFDINKPDPQYTNPYFIDDGGSDDIYGNYLRYDYKVLENDYKKLGKIYFSDRIYNFDKPIITDILQPYLESDNIADPANDGKVKDYKVFYLFGNYSETSIRNLKCEHQYKLLQNTKNFISTIAGVV